MAEAVLYQIASTYKAYNAEAQRDCSPCSAARHQESCHTRHRAGTAAAATGRAASTADAQPAPSHLSCLQHACLPRYDAQHFRESSACAGQRASLQGQKHVPPATK